MIVEVEAVLDKPIGSFNDPEQVSSKEKARKVGTLLGKALSKKDQPFLGRLVGCESTEVELDELTSQLDEEFENFK